MAYTKFTWTESTDSEITSARLNNLESQHELALVDARAASSNPLHAQIVSSYPTHGTGKLIYHTGEGKFFASNGTVWLPVATPPRTGHVTGQSHSISGTTLRFRPEAGYYPGDAGNSVQRADANFVAGNIKDGVSVFGLAGSYKAGYDENGGIVSTNTPYNVTYQVTLPVAGVILLTYALRTSYSSNLTVETLLNGNRIQHSTSFTNTTTTFRRKSIYTSQPAGDYELEVDAFRTDNPSSTFPDFTHLSQVVAIWY